MDELTDSPSSPMSGTGSIVAARSILAVAFTLCFLLLSAFAVYAAYSNVTPYDDEGYVMLGQQGFNEGHALYDEIYTQYGPFSFMVRKLLYDGILHTPIDHNTNRLISLSFYVLSALAFSIVAFRLTHSTFASAITLLSSGYVLVPVASYEPGHPQEIVIFLIAIAMLTATLVNRPMRRAMLLGTILAAATMTKINTGAFSMGALVMTFVFFARSGNLATRALWIGIAVLATLAPIAIMREALFEGASSSWSQPVAGGVLSYAQLYVALVIASMIGFLGVATFRNRASPIASPSLAPMGCALMASAIAVGAIAGYTLAQGTSLQSLLDGVVLRPLEETRVFIRPRFLQTRDFVIALSGLVAAFAYTTCGRFLTPVNRQYAIGTLKVIIGFVVLASYTHLAVAGTDNRINLAVAAWIWPLLVRPIPSREEERDGEFFAPLFLGLIAIFNLLYIYPAPGSQVRLAAAPFFPLAAILLTQGVQELARPLRRKSRPWTRLLAAALQVMLISAYVASVYDRQQLSKSTVYPFLNRTKTTALQGAEWLRMDRARYAQYASLVYNLQAHTDTFFALGGPGSYRFNSLYFWTAMPPPTHFNGSIVWYDLLRPKEKRAIHAALEAADRPGIVSTLRKPFSWKGSLKDYFRAEYAQALRIGDYSLFLKKQRASEPIAMWLLTGERTFFEETDALPLLSSLFEKKLPLTLSLDFKTTESGVILGLQFKSPSSGFRKRYPAIYVGTDGKLRSLFWNVHQLQLPMSTQVAVNDGNWHHVVIHVTEQDQHLYCDGVEVGSRQGKLELSLMPRADLGWGRWHLWPGSGGSGFVSFKGSLRDVRMVSGVQEN